MKNRLIVIFLLLAGMFPVYAEAELKDFSEAIELVRIICSVMAINDCEWPEDIKSTWKRNSDYIAELDESSVYNAELRSLSYGEYRFIARSSYNLEKKEVVFGESKYIIPLSGNYFRLTTPYTDIEGNTDKYYFSRMFIGKAGADRIEYCVSSLTDINNEQYETFELINFNGKTLYYLDGIRIPLELKDDNIIEKMISHDKTFFLESYLKTIDRNIGKSKVEVEKLLNDYFDDYNSVLSEVWSWYREQYVEALDDAYKEIVDNLFEAVLEAGGTYTIINRLDDQILVEVVTDLMSYVESGCYWHLIDYYNIFMSGRDLAPDDYSDNYLFLYSVKDGNIENVKTLSRFNWHKKPMSTIDMDGDDEAYYGGTVSVAAGEGQAEILEYLLEDLKLDPDEKQVTREGGIEDVTPIEWACINKHIDCVKVLVDYGASVNFTDQYGNTPLSLSVNKSDEISDYLIKNGADVSVLPPETILWATYHNYPKTIRHLINSDFDVNLLYDGYTALHIAARDRHLELVKLLVENGADINRIIDITTEDGTVYSFTPLGIAEHNNNTEIIDYLRRKGGRS